MNKSTKHKKPTLQNKTTISPQNEEQIQSKMENQSIIAKFKCLYRIQKSSQEYILDILQDNIFLYIHKQGKSFGVQINYQSISNSSLKVDNRTDLLNALSSCQLVFAQCIKMKLRLSLTKEHNTYQISFSLSHLEQINKSKYQNQLKTFNFQYKKEIQNIKQQDNEVEQSEAGDEITSDSCLKSENTKLQIELNLMEDKYKLIQDYNNQLEQQCKQYKIQIQNYKKLASHKGVNYTENKQSLKSKPPIKYVINDYQNYTKISLGSDYRPQQNQFIHQEQFQICGIDKNKKKLASKDTLNRFTFKIFTLNKNLDNFDIRRDNCIRLRQHVKSYFQVISWYSIPMMGVTKIGFKVINSKNLNIYVGVLRSMRRRAIFSTHQEKLISYKIRGGRNALCINGEFDEAQCEMIENNQILWMTINRSVRTIEWTKNYSLITQLPDKFWREQLYPFITMRDKDDEIQVLSN